jgi:hypothetical protein
MAIIQSTSQKMTIKDSDNRFDVYSNHTGIMLTGFDVKLLFGMVQAATESEVIILQHGSVVMSPQHAKVFSISLAKAVSDYEKLNGEIRVPAGNDTIKEK